MVKHRYHFDKSSKKFRCPACQKKTFVLYVDSVTGNYMAEKYGKCDREINCGYFEKPAQDKELNLDRYNFQKKKKHQPKV